MEKMQSVKRNLKESGLFKGEEAERDMVTYFQQVDGCCKVKGDLPL